MISSFIIKLTAYAHNNKCSAVAALFCSVVPFERESCFAL